MAMTAGRWRLAGWLVLAAALAMGCNLASLSYFLFPGGDLRQAPELATLAPLEKGKPVKVLKVHGGKPSCVCVPIRQGSPP